MTDYASVALRETEWRLGHGRSVMLGPKAHIMAVVNVTPDSFSDGGLYAATETAVRHVRSCAQDGALIVDIGGESTRPGAASVSAAEEQDRVLPVIEALSGSGKLLISVDTYRAETARLAVAAGAHIINDVHGAQREPEIAEVAASTGAGLVLMHTGRDREQLPDVIDDQLTFFARSLEIADRAGVDRRQIVLDPGFGFAKETAEINMDLMARFSELHALGLPLLAGTSRKRFIGALTGREAPERDVGTAATSVILRLMGAAIFRVHNVAMSLDALAIADAMLAARERMTGRSR